MIVSAGSSKDYYVEIKANTWSKDSHGLYDYESMDSKVEKFKCDESFRVFRKDAFVFISPITTALYNSVSGDIILDVINNRESVDKFTVTVPQRTFISQQMPNDIFIIVRTLRDEATDAPYGCELQAGSVYKLGRVEFHVLELRGESELDLVKCQNLPDFSPSPAKSFMPTATHDAPKICRICLTDNKSDILYSPCNCKGSLQHVHFQCLREWFKSKVVTKMTGTHTVNYLVSNIVCEVCKSEIEPIFSYDGVQHELFHIERPEWPYMIIEHMERGTNQRLYHLISFFADSPDSEVYIGRGHDCGIRLTDISVSRKHAIIKFNNGRYSLFDNQSKFGTLVLASGAITLSGRKIGLQVGKTAMTCVLKKKGPTKVEKASDMLLESVGNAADFKPPQMPSKPGNDNFNGYSYK